MDKIEDLQKRVAEFRDKRDWAQFHNPKDLAIAISIEAAELLECFRWKTTEEVRVLMDSDKSFAVKEEMADVLLLLLNLADTTGIDVVAEAYKKLEENDRKYPVEKSKGSAKKYTELV
jgi:dCTP diphosphatase